MWLLIHSGVSYGAKVILGLSSLSGKASQQQISLSLEATSMGVKIMRSPWYLTGASAALLSRHFKPLSRGFEIFEDQMVLVNNMCIISQCMFTMNHNGVHNSGHNFGDILCWEFIHSSDAIKLQWLKSSLWRFWKKVKYEVLQFFNDEHRQFTPVSRLPTLYTGALSYSHTMPNTGIVGWISIPMQYFKCGNSVTSCMHK